MKIFIPFLASVLLVACSTPAPVAGLVRNAGLESRLCPDLRYPTFEKKNACKLAVRKDLTAKAEGH